MLYEAVTAKYLHEKFPDALRVDFETSNDWWQHVVLNTREQEIYRADSNGYKRWTLYKEDGSLDYEYDNVPVIDTPLARTVEQRLEALESSVDHISQQMKLIINSMVVEYKLGDYE